MSGKPSLPLSLYSMYTAASSSVSSSMRAPSSVIPTVAGPVKTTGGDVSGFDKVVNSPVFATDSFSLASVRTTEK